MGWQEDKRREEDEFYGDNIGDASLIERLLTGVFRMITIWIPDDDVRKAAQEDVERAGRAAHRIRKRNLDRQDKRGRRR